MVQFPRPVQGSSAEESFDVGFKEVFLLQIAREAINLAAGGRVRVAEPQGRGGYSIGVRAGENDQSSAVFDSSLCDGIPDSSSSTDDEDVSPRELGDVFVWGRHFGGVYNSV